MCWGGVFEEGEGMSFVSLVWGFGGFFLCFGREGFEFLSSGQFFGFDFVFTGGFGSFFLSGFSSRG